MKILDDLKDFALIPDSWDVVRVLRSGHEEVVATAVPLSQASQMANRILARGVPGVTVSLREAVNPALWVDSGSDD